MEEVEAISVSTSSTEQTVQSVPDGENKEVQMEIEEMDEQDEDIPRLAIEGFDDDGEEAVIMTLEEAKGYILKKVLEYMKDSKVNPLLVVQNEILDYHKQIQQKNEEFNKLSKVFEVLYRDQVKFLRHIGVMSKADTKTVAVAVDLPWTSESIGGVDVKKDSNRAPPSVKNDPLTTPAKKVSTCPVECIDLSSDEEVSEAKTSSSTVCISSKNIVVSKPAKPNILAAPARFSPMTCKPLMHPAPLPAPPLYIGDEVIPLKPKLKISVESKGIVLQWDMPNPKPFTTIKKYEIFGYQEKPDVRPSTSLWKKIGSVDSMRLPMSCTLTQFVEGYNYHFSIRAIAPPDISGPFSEPATINFRSLSG